MIGILKDLSIRIEQKFILADFFVMEMEEDFQIAMLLGIHFLAAVWAIIDVKRGKLTFEVAGEKIEFILSKLIKNYFLEILVVKLT